MVYGHWLVNIVITLLLLALRLVGHYHMATAMAHEVIVIVIIVSLLLAINILAGHYYTLAELVVTVGHCYYHCHWLSLIALLVVTLWL